MSEPSIHIKDLHKSYGQKQVLKGLTLDVYPGELFGFIGKNGIGKSTTIDCLVGAKRFESGEVSIMGHDIKKEPLDAKMSFGYVASEPNCYEVMSGYDYLNFVASLYHVDEEQYEKNINLLSNKLGLSEDDLKKPSGEYSHGMKQKLCLMASIMHVPDVWILDEPTVGLDIIAVENLLELLRFYADNGKTVFLTSHNIDLVSNLCDRVAIVNDGVVAKTLDMKKDPNARLRLRNTFKEVYKEK